MPNAPAATPAKKSPRPQPPTLPPQAWRLPAERTLEAKFWIFDSGRSLFVAMQPGDAVLLTDRSGCWVWGVRRVCVAYMEGPDTCLAFDRAIDLPQSIRLEAPVLQASGQGARRCAMEDVQTVLHKAGEPAFGDLPPPDKDDKENQAFVRDLLEKAFRTDLLGPAGGEEEELREAPRIRYLVGRLGPLDPATGSGGSPAAPADAARAETPAEETPDWQALLAESAAIRKAAALRQPSDSRQAFDISEEEDEEDVAETIDLADKAAFTPSSMGMTFCLDAKLPPKINVGASWGRYAREPGSGPAGANGRPRLCWRRHPQGGSRTMPLKEGPIAPFSIDPSHPEIKVQGRVTAPVGNIRLVTLFLVNTQPPRLERKDEAWIFQPRLVVSSPTRTAIFRKQPNPEANREDAELQALDLLYRHEVEYAVGHNAAVHVDLDGNAVRSISTTFIPECEIPVTGYAGESPDDRPALLAIAEGGWLDMRKIAAACATGESFAELRRNLFDPLLDDYAQWIDDCGSAARGERLDATYGDAATANLDRCRETLDRLRRGVETLASDLRARQAFAFANSVMADQRIHSILARARRRLPENAPAPDPAAFDIPRNRSWRVFQVAFILLALPALADPSSPERTDESAATADLLWFPTGGGKTEAYLGLSAFAMAIRRLQGPLGGFDASRGLAVIMRYTLRLLTLQQFQRASTLVCAMERERAAHPDVWGTTPFTIGLWVGQKTTPNTTRESADAIAAERNGNRPSGSSPAQLTTCPWCGAPIDPGHDIFVDLDVRKTRIFCSDDACPFSRGQGDGEGLPVTVVDEEIYRRPPSMMIATVDKFAQMAWKGAVRSLFGRVQAECPRHGLLLPDDSDCNGNHKRNNDFPATAPRSIQPIRPPDFVIQDEFHLIGGPLGTLVGLYETAIDRLCSWEFDGKTVRPKIVASTATVRKASDQMRGVFLRRCGIFPPSGIDVADNFFSVRRSGEGQYGRRYLGVCAPGISRPATLIRVYVALLTAAQDLFDRFGALADPYMTAVGYFNSLRELGGMRRFCEDDVRNRCRLIFRRGLAKRKLRTIAELTSRISNRDIPKTLDWLETSFHQGGSDGGSYPVDVALATNMLSVGVDVGRLGLMIVSGQPKNTAEYIQSTSRVGRSFPGLVCTVLSWARPRDFSHYESFEHFHATFYKHVEAQSVTPFAKRALDRGLTGAMVSLVRLGFPGFAENAGAQRLTSTTADAAATAKETFIARARAVGLSRDSAGETAARVDERIDKWVKEASTPGRRLVYDMKAAGSNGGASLLRKPKGDDWTKLSVPMSLREVEGTSRLVINAATLPTDELQAHPWQPPPPPPPPGGSPTAPAPAPGPASQEN